MHAITLRLALRLSEAPGELRMVSPELQNLVIVRGGDERPKARASCLAFAHPERNEHGLTDATRRWFGGFPNRRRLVLPSMGGRGNERRNHQGARRRPLFPNPILGELDHHDPCLASSARAPVTLEGRTPDHHSRGETT